MRRSVILSLLLSLFIGAGFAQTPDDKTTLEDERRQLQKEIKEIKDIYSKVKSETNVTLGQANLLRRKIELQEEYVNSISRQLKYIDNDLYRSNLEVYRLERQLDTLKQQYARSVVYAYKNRSSYDFLNFIFSTDNFNDALKRINYLKNYRAYRQQQVANILETKKQIELKKNLLQNKRADKQVAVKDQAEQINELEQQKKEKEAVANKLKAKQGDLKKQLVSKQKRDKDLQRQIAAIIQREIDIARKKARDEEKRLAEIERKRKEAEAKNNTGAVTVPNTVVKTPAIKTPTPAKKEAEYLIVSDKDRALDASFEKNRGSLPWPVDGQFYVSTKFGSYKDETSGLINDNPGITISTASSGAAVKSVFNGDVTGVFSIGEGMTVVIKHGKYFTVYSNLSSVSVSKGASVSSGQAIGRAGAADDGSGGMIEFLLMKEKQKVNPQLWLRR
jgi:murein hydrolase activator